MGDDERTMYAWAKGAGAILVCGHSHRAYFASRSRAGELRDELRVAIDGAAEGGIRLVFWDTASGKRKAWHDEPLGLQSGGRPLRKVQQAHGTRASGSH